MEKSFSERCLKSVGIALSASIIVISLFLPVQASVYSFFDDFEDGDAIGWSITSNGSGSTGVEEHNGSKMAFSNQIGNTEHSLSYDFNYSDNYILSFAMQAEAYSAYNDEHNSSSGVKISFLNSFNIEQGSAGIIYATDSNWLSTNDYALRDMNEHYYSDFMSEYATLAGLSNTASISKISLTFFANGSEGFHYSNTGYGHTYETNSTVWFDNVSIVPIPGAILLLGLGLLGLAGISRRRDL